MLRRHWGKLVGRCLFCFCFPFFDYFFSIFVAAANGQVVVIIIASLVVRFAVVLVIIC